MLTVPHDQAARNQQLKDEQHNVRARVEESATRKLRCKKMSDDATLPTRAHDTDAGWDLYSSVHRIIAPSKRGLINTGISMEIPEGYAGLIWPRSGLAVKDGIDVFAGVIDSGYRGEIKVCLFNSSQLYIEIQKGDRVAQILFQEVPKMMMEVEVDELNESQRGGNGFGSSGS